MLIAKISAKNTSKTHVCGIAKLGFSSKTGASESAASGEMALRCNLFIIDNQCNILY